MVIRLKPGVSKTMQVFGAIAFLAYALYFCICFGTAQTFSLLPPPGPQKVVIFHKNAEVHAFFRKIYLPLIGFTESWRFYPNLEEHKQLQAGLSDTWKATHLK